MASPDCSPDRGSDRRSDDAPPDEAAIGGFLKWSAISLAVVITLGVLVARLLHALDIH